MIPSDIHAEIISFPETSIIVATSPTVINSVTLMTFFSDSICSKSSDLFLWVSLFSFLYFAPLDFDVPWSFSNVSLICFWTSSSEGAEVLMEDFLFLNWGFFVICSLLITSFAILLLFFLFLLSESPSLGLLNLFKSIFSPVFFNPESFSYFVWIFESFSVVLSTVFLSEIKLSSFLVEISFIGFKSISPTFLNLWKEDFEVIVLDWAFCSCSFSNFILNSSFSLFFSSIRSWDSTLLDLSDLNSASKRSYWLWEIFVVGLASISWPFEERNSTTLSREILNSLITLFNLILFNSDIN